MVDIFCLSTCIAFPSQDFVILIIGFVQRRRDWFRYKFIDFMPERKSKKEKEERMTKSIEANIKNGALCRVWCGQLTPKNHWGKPTRINRIVTILYKISLPVGWPERAEREECIEYVSMIGNRRRLGSAWQFIYLCNIINCVTLAGDGVNEKAPKINSANKFDVFELICARNSP